MDNSIVSPIRQYKKPWFNVFRSAMALPVRLPTSLSAHMAAPSGTKSVSFSVPLSDIEAARCEAVSGACLHFISDRFVNRSTGEVVPVNEQVGIDILRRRRGGFFEPLNLTKIVSHSSSYSGTSARARVSLGGSLVSVSRDRLSVRGGRRGSKPGIRGLASFSAGSRRRLMRLLASLRRVSLPLFVTMTYPDIFPRSSDEWKRHLHNFSKRFRRRFPAGSFVWRLEVLPRKSGVNVGLLAPHFHLLVFGVPYSDLLSWLSSAWYGVVGSADERHLRAGCRVEKVRSVNGVMFYASKYLSKIDSASVSGFGRWWGVVNREKLPVAPVLVLPLLDDYAKQAVRFGRKMLRLGSVDLCYGLTWIMSSERFLDYLEFLEGD